MDLKSVPVTYWLLGIILIVFIAQVAVNVTFTPVILQTPFGTFGVGQFDWNFALWPTRVLQGDVMWGIVTSIFLHANILHIFFNGWALYLFGLYLEKLIGGKNLLGVFFVAGIVGSFAHIAFSVIVGNAGLYALGASGAIFGVLGALAVLEPNLKVIMMPVPIPLPLWQAVIMFVVFMSIIFGLGGLSGIAQDVHVAGLTVGVVMGLMYKKRMASDKDFTWRAVYAPPEKQDPYAWIDEYR